MYAKRLGMMSPEKIRLLIVEEQPEVRRVMHMRLAAEADIFVIGEACDARTAVVLASTLCPEIVLVDVDVPGANGMQIAADIHDLCPQTAMIVLSMQDDPQTHSRALCSGAWALVDKSQPTEVLLAAIRDVAAGKVAY